MRICCWCAILFAAVAVNAAELKFDFSGLREQETPPGFRSTVSGKGKPGQWQIVLDAVPPLLPPLTPQAPAVSKRPVLAQRSQDPTDEHFPLLIYEEEVFDDFTLTTRFKTVSGVAEQMAGVAFRIQNETNYYVLRASSAGNNFRFYKVVNGQRGTIIGPEVPVPVGVWHEMAVECKGNQIRCLLDGKELIPWLGDTSFRRGKIGFWTKSDAVSYFSDATITYTPTEAPAQRLVRAVTKEYPRLLGLKIYVGQKPGDPPRLVAGSNETEIGQPGGETEESVLKDGSVFYGKNKDSVSVIMPLRDRNGDVIAAVRVVLKTFAGQTEQNAIMRATPIVKGLQAKTQSLDDLVQ